MSVENSNKWSVFLKKWYPFLIITFTVIGAILGAFLYYLYQGEFPYEVVVGGLIAAVILTVIEVIKRKRKKDNVPEADERVIHNMFRFSAYVSHIYLAVLFISLPIFLLSGNESIPLLYLWIFFFSYIWIVGIGTLIIKRR